MEPQPAQHTLSPKRAAERIGVHEQTLVTWRRMGVGPRFIKRGGRIYYPVPDLDQWYINGDPLSE